MFRCNGGKKKNKKKRKKTEEKIEEIENNEIDKIDTETEIMETADTSTNQVKIYINLLMIHIRLSSIKIEG